MQRPTIWLTLVVLLLGILFLREPRLERSEEFFLRWLLRNSEPHGPAAPLTVVEIGHDSLLEAEAGQGAVQTPPVTGAGLVSPFSACPPIANNNSGYPSGNYSVKRFYRQNSAS